VFISANHHIFENDGDATAQDFKSSSYQSLSLDVKAMRLRNAIFGNTNSYGWPSVLHLPKLFIQDNNRAFDTVADEMPKQFFYSALRRKLIHSVGAVGEAKWVSKGNHPYTGCFKGARHVFVRLSLAQKQKPDNITPGMAVKFIRARVKSGNFMSMFSLRGQSSGNFFKNDFTNHVPDISKDANFQERLLLNNFMKVSKIPTMVGLSDIATYDENGNRESRPVFPFELVLKVPSGLRKFISDSDRDFLSSLERVNNRNTPILYHVYARANPGSSLTHIADIELKSSLSASNFGDKHLYFQHQRMEDDVKLRPEWASRM
jgi:hypothetical protein